MSEENKLPQKYVPPSLERVGKLIEIGNKLSKIMYLVLLLIAVMVKHTRQ